MQLYTALLICLFILCAARTIETPLRLLNLDIARVAAMSILLLFANNLIYAPIQEVSINIGAMLLCLLTGISAAKDGDASRAVAYAIPASFIMLIISYTSLEGQGLFMALACVPFLFVLTPKGALFLAALSPVLVSVYKTAMELYLYGYAIMEIGVVETLDAQIAGLLIAGMLLSALSYRREKLRVE